ncbi:MAG: hypothetical protein FWG21_05490, partial [Oscillospiraceae bacterium]|nr:hypothetical protein [Oscillospiraceae bacterium]
YGERYVASYKAIYLSEIALPDMPGYNCIATYRIDFIITEQPLEKEEEDIIHTPEEIILTENYLQVNKHEPTLTLFQKVLIALSGVLLLAGAAVLILYVIRKRLREKDDEQEGLLLRGGRDKSA